METIQLKTTIKCSGCIAKVTPVLNELAGAENWQVDLQSPDRILTISGNNINKKDIKAAIENIGFRSEELTR